VDGAPLWAVVAAGVLAVAGDLVYGGLWLAARATGARPPRRPERRIRTLDWVATVAVVFAVALVTRNWLFVALLAVPAIITLALLARVTVRVARSRR
jgi:hypothetical protein